MAALRFVDDEGGALASLAAGVARASGHADATAGTTVAAKAPPSEVAAVLAEIGAKPVDVTSDAPVDGSGATGSMGGARTIVLGRGKAWDIWLYAGEGDLERLSAARIARDKIARAIELGR